STSVFHSNLFLLFLTNDNLFINSFESDEIHFTICSSIFTFSFINISGEKDISIFQSLFILHLFSPNHQKFHPKYNQSAFSFSD
ncbi:MAG: hypothetical protein U9N34_08325, partial [Candidatus Cloacimonadota bacterium]|nr:hypothetical protein [Candidatus Cloacimonadota bacterium]